MLIGTRRTFDGRDAEFIRQDQWHRHWRFRDNGERFKTKPPKRCRAKHAPPIRPSENVYRLCVANGLTKQQTAKFIEKIGG